MNKAIETITITNKNHKQLSKSQSTIITTIHQPSLSQSINYHCHYLNHNHNHKSHQIKNHNQQSTSNQKSQSTINNQQSTITLNQKSQSTINNHNQTITITVHGKIIQDFCLRNDHRQYKSSAPNQSQGKTRYTHW